MKSLSINEIIEIRKVYDLYAPCNWLNKVNKKCWVGCCQEIIGALVGDNSHRVSIVDGHVVIFRNSYTAPHFVHVSGGNFVCIFWK